MSYTKVGNTYVKEEILTVIDGCIKTNQPALMVGETGTGKTSVIREMAKIKGHKLYRVSLSGNTGVEEILGKWLADKGSTVWQDGALITAMKEGAWIVFDEINAALPEVLFVLHSLLDDDKTVMLMEKQNELITPHKGFRFFATMNPPEDYAGTKDVNRALMSRFQAVLWIESLPEIEEVRVVNQESGASEADAQRLVILAGKLRKLKEKGEIFHFISTRDLVQSGRLIASGISFEVSFEMAVLNKMSRFELDAISDKVKNYLTTEHKYVPIEQLLIDNRDLTQMVELMDKDIIKLRETVSSLSAKAMADMKKGLADDIAKSLAKKAKT